MEIALNLTPIARVVLAADEPGDAAWREASRTFLALRDARGATLSSDLPDAWVCHSHSRLARVSFEGKVYVPAPDHAGGRGTFRGPLHVVFDPAKDE